jgi:hypothetical protein
MHTKGPWKVAQPQGAFGYEVIAEHETDWPLICQMTPYLSRRPASAANARLIAAAPEMLAALKAIAEMDIGEKMSATTRQMIDRLLTRIEGRNTWPSA